MKAARSRRRVPFAEKQQRQERFIERAVALGLSPAEQNEAAKLFPKAAVAQMRVLRWVR